MPFFYWPEGISGGGSGYDMEANRRIAFIYGQNRQIMSKIEDLSIIAFKEAVRHTAALVALHSRAWYVKKFLGDSDSFGNYKTQ